MTEVLLGFEKGTAAPVNIGITHSVFAAITRAGKSETVKAAVARSKTIRFLILDVKKPRDYADLGVPVPIYVEDTTEPLMLKRLLESQSHLALKFEFPELLKVCKKASTYPEILDAVTQGLEAKSHPIVKDKLLVLQHLLTRLVKELQQTPISDKLELTDRINVMDLSDVSKELQQLAVHSTLKTLLKHHENIVVIADEFHRFAPQYGSNPSKDTVTDFIKEGGAKHLWLWVIDQTITGVDKQILKQCWLWVLGKQREVNEAKRTLDQIPFKTGLTDKAIMRLKVGHFIVCTEDFAKVTYVWLPGVPRDLAKQVARGDVDVRKVIPFLEQEENDLIWKEKYEQEKRRREDLEAKIVKLETRRDELEQHLGRADSELERLFALEKDVEAIEQIKQGLRQLIPAPIPIPPGPDPGSNPADVHLTQAIPNVILKKDLPTVETNETTWQGRIVSLVAAGFFDNPQKLKAVQDELDRAFAIRGRSGTISNELAKLCPMRILQREHDGSSWSYRAFPGVKDRIAEAD